MKNKQKPSWILYMGTFPPRKCGIATFTKDLTTAIDKKFNPTVKSKILAMNHEGININNYPKDVVLQMDDNDIRGYVDMAKRINKIDAIKLVNIQHEFNIFGGLYGKYLLKFIETLNKPLIVTFHTVVPSKISKKKTRTRVVQAIAKKAKCIIVLNELAVNILKKDYGIDNSKIVVIHHGIHDIQYEDSIKEKTKLGYKNRRILSTFGFIRKSKGTEYIINALPKVIDKFPNVLYLIIGEVHPRHRVKGENYLKLLKNRVKELGIQNNVKFINKYVTLDKLIRYLKATDLYLCSTTSKGQIVSGTLAYAMGCGRAIVSASFLHAEEVVSRERGRVVDDFKNPALFSDAIIEILLNPLLKEKMEKNAYEYTRHMTWSNVADSYMKIFSEYL